MARSRVPSQVRDRQRQVAEREAARLARPEAPQRRTLPHADRRKSAVTSTPSGVVRTSISQPVAWCGPFAVARQMIAEREEALRREQEEAEEEANMLHPLDQAMEELQAATQRKQHPSIHWKSRRQTSDDNESPYRKRQKLVHQVKIPSLFDLCVTFVVDHFEHVDRLGPVDHAIRTAIAYELVSRHALNDLTPLVEDGMETLEIVDASQITQEHLASVLEQLGSLRYLILDQAGRCLGPKAVQVLEQRADRLQALSIGGAYLWKDEDAARLITVCTKLSSIQCKACPLLGKEFAQAVASCPSLVELALYDLNLESDSIQQLAKLSSLQSLSLGNIRGLSDDLVETFLIQSGHSLQLVDLSDNPQLTDGVLASIRTHAVSLRSLHLARCKGLTPQGLEALFTIVETISPPSLSTIDLGNVDHEAVTDDLVRLMMEASDQGVVHLDLQGARNISDRALESIVKECSESLEVLNVSFCPLLSDSGLGFLVDRCPRLRELQVWGCAQLTDEFFDGHARVSDPSLVIIGAWMKKNSGRTVQ